MGLVTDRQFAQRISFSYKLVKTKSLAPLQINCRCPVCNDSATDEYKTRFWFLEEKSKVYAYCHNCTYSAPLWKHIKDHHESEYMEYIMESRMEDGHGSSMVASSNASMVEIEIKNKAVLPVIQESVIDQYGIRIDKLPDGHPAKLYMQNRLIPADKLKLFWFTMKWKELANEVKADTYLYTSPEPRIVIPIFNADRSISSMQGRALRSNESIRYLTIKSHEDATKIFGLERVDESRHVFITEGPIDSVFLDNAIAITGGNLALVDVPFKNKRVWAIDNEPRSIDTCKRIKKLIEANERIVLFDDPRFNAKDINDMILKDGLTATFINDYMNKNVVQGLSAQMRFSSWCKVKV